MSKNQQEGPPDPSQPLRNARHERFVQNVVKDGLSDIQAYKQAFGCTYEAAVSSAQRMRVVACISARIAHLQSQAANSAVLTLEQSLGYLTNAILTSPDKIDASSILCQEYSVSDNGTIKNKPVCKMKAMEMLSKLTGRLVDRQEIKHEFVLTPEDSGSVESFAKMLAEKKGKS